MSYKKTAPDWKFLAASSKTVGIKPLFKFGRNVDVDTATVPEDVHTLGGAKLFPSAASTVSIVSTSTQDGVAGTGIRTLIIEGVDATYEETIEEVIMDGTGAVVTTNSFLRVNRMYGTMAGTSGSAVGTITATHSEGAIIEIIPTAGQTGDCSYTVPLGYSFIIDRLTASLLKSSNGSAATLTFEIRKAAEGVWREQADISVSGQGTSHVDRDSDIWFYIPEKTDIRVRVTYVATNNCSIFAAFDGFLVREGEYEW